MEKTDKIRTLAVSLCPHCGKQVFVELEMLPPMVIATLSPEQIQKAKAEVKIAINGMPISEKEKKEAKEWVNLESTVFGPEEVQDIIEGIKNTK